MFKRLVLSAGSTVALNGVWHRYGNSDEAWTLRGVDLEIAPGELVGLLGSVTQELCGRPSAGLQLSHQGQVILYLQVVYSRLSALPLTLCFSFPDIP